MSNKFNKKELEPIQCYANYLAQHWINTELIEKEPI